MFLSKGFVSHTMKTGVCKHYFIPSVNLWGEQVLGKSAGKVSRQSILGCEILEKTLRGDITKIITPDIFTCELLLQNIFSLPPYPFYSLATLLWVLAYVLVVPSLPVLCLGIVVTIQTIVAWLLGIITCLPVVIIYTFILVITRHVVMRY